jgi:hypothetical protein
MHFEFGKQDHFAAHEDEPAERAFVSRERLGGPFKPHELLTTRLGVDESKPILKQIGVHHRISLYAPEVPLDTEAQAPAEFRIEIMDPEKPDVPAQVNYVEFVFHELRKAQVPIQRAADPQRDDHEQNN